MKVDTLIQARWIIPVEPDSVILEDHSLVIDKGRIVELLPNDAALHKYRPVNLECKQHHALIPGFVNAHTHAAMTLLRGIADDLPLMEWLQNHIWPLEQKWIGEAFVRDGVDLAIAEMLRGGTTCFNDMYFFPEIVAHQAVLHGIRASIGLILVDFPTPWAQNSEEYLAKGLALHEQVRHEPLITTPFAPHAPYTVSDAPLQRIRTLADQLDAPIHMHVHETPAEVEQAVAQHGLRPLERLDSLGLLTPLFIGVHMTQLNGADIARYAESGAHIVHCPESNLKLASGFSPVAQCLKAGINVALGTDGAASNNDLDMLGEMRSAALLGKMVAGDASVLPAHTVLRMATLNGAKALGLDAVIGSLQSGKAADVVAIDLDELETQPLYHPVSQIVYAATRQQVTDVWVAGKHLLQQRQLTTFDVAELKAKAALWRDRLRQYS
ncbi:MAG: TRZ/ATZ family hydrolase [Gammaproteobacteria bacterium]